MYIVLVIVLMAVVIIAMVITNLKEGYLNSLYATLGNYGNTPLFEPDWMHRCDDYMNTSNPQLASACASPEHINKVKCGKVHNGKPLTFEYTAPAYGQCSVACGDREQSLMLV